ncbi:unnamed protein product [Gordionus sp. m RMFG-2023]
MIDNTCKNNDSKQNGETVQNQQLPNNLLLVTSSNIPLSSSPFISQNGHLQKPSFNIFENKHSIMTNEELNPPLDPQSMTRKDLTKIYERLKLSQYELNKGCPLTTKFEFYPMRIDDKNNITAYKIFYLAPLNTCGNNFEHTNNSLSLNSKLNVVTILYSEIQIPTFSDNYVVSAKIYHQDANDSTIIFGRMDKESNDLTNLIKINNNDNYTNTKSQNMFTTINRCPRFPLLSTEVYDAKISQKYIFYDKMVKNYFFSQIVNNNLDKASSSLSKEEILLRERKRLPSLDQNQSSSSATQSDLSPNLTSITDFEYLSSTIFTKQSAQNCNLNFNEGLNRARVDDCGLLFSLHSQIFTVPVQALGSSHDMGTCPTPLNLSQTTHPYDLKICPDDAGLLAFVSERNLFVFDTRSSQFLRLTSSRDKDIMCGVPSFVIQEEFDRFTGYYWKPTRQLVNYSNQNSENRIFKYTILYEENDERLVDTLKIPTDLCENLVKMEEQKFPRPGSINSKSVVKMVEFIHDSYSFKFLPFPTVNLEHENVDQNFVINSMPSFQYDDHFREVLDLEYLVRFGWVLDTNMIWLQGLNREQSTLKTFVISTDSFVKTGDSRQNLSGLNKDNICVYPLYLETSQYWINVSNILHFLDQGDSPNISDPIISFLILSEESGFRHLYRIEAHVTNAFNTSGHVFAPEIASKIQLTHGEWSVGGDKIWVNEKKGLLHFMANKDGPLEKHLYVTSYSCPTESYRLTKLGCSHNIHMDKNCKIFVDCFSNAETPTHINVYDIHDAETGSLDRLEVSLIAVLHRPDDYNIKRYALPPPQFFTFPVKHDIINYQNLGLSLNNVITKTRNDDDDADSKKTTMLHGMIFKPFRIEIEPNLSNLASMATDIANFEKELRHEYCYDDEENLGHNIRNADHGLAYNDGPGCEMGHLDPQMSETNGLGSDSLTDTIKNDGSGRSKNGRLEPRAISPIKTVFNTNGHFIDPQESLPMEKVNEKTKKKPTLLYLYGGPHVQQVTNTYKGNFYLRLYNLNALGFTCVVIDNRGSFNRGIAFEGFIKHKMGTIELDDQIEGLKYISEKTGLIDMDRVAIHGWSYGGYLSLMGLITKLHSFKMAISGAPVTTWSQYDTGYTERYMGVLTGRFPNSNIVEKAHLFPDEENRLLLIHGLMDENVHFHNTALLIQELIKHNKPYRLLVIKNNSKYCLNNNFWIDGRLNSL